MAVNKTKWCEESPIDIYEYARDGLTNDEIAEAMGISSSTLRDRWMASYPVVRTALERGRIKMKETKARDKEEGGKLVDYVFSRLSPQLQTLWQQLEFWHEAASGPEKIEAILGKQSTKVRQQLWMHAMLACDFNGSDACRMVNISKRTLDWWTAHDADFVLLVDELHYHKKNFFEAQMIRSAKAYNEKTIVHANATLNRDRGYGKTMAVDVSGTVQHNHAVIPLEKLNLPVDVLLQIEEAMKALPSTEETPSPAGPLRIAEKAAVALQNAQDDAEEDEDGAVDTEIVEDDETVSAKKQPEMDVTRFKREMFLLRQQKGYNK